jgi:hypothetical protein
VKQINAIELIDFKLAGACRNRTDPSGLWPETLDLKGTKCVFEQPLKASDIKDIFFIIRGFSFIAMLAGVGWNWMVFSAHGHKMGTVISCEYTMETVN